MSMLCGKAAIDSSSVLDELEDHRQHRDEDDADGDEREVVLDDRHVAEEIARAHAERHPRDAARDVVEEERPALISAAPATNGRNVRTIGTNRARTTALPPCVSKNSWARFTCSGLIRRCENAGPVATAEQPRTDPPADRVVHARRREWRRHQQHEAIATGSARRLR